MLDQVSIFSGLSQQELQTLNLHAKPKRFRKNTIIISQGDESSTLYLLLSGKVRVFVADEDGKEMVLQVCEQAGTQFGELALLGDTRRTASVETLEDSEFLVIAKHDFIAAVSEHPQIALAIISHLVQKITQLTDRLSIFGLNDVYGRLAATLRELAQEDESGQLVTPRLTQQELAQMIGASREMVSRIFKELRAGDYIRIENGRVFLDKKLPSRW